MYALVKVRDLLNAEGPAKMEIREVALNGKRKEKLCVQGAEGVYIPGLEERVVTSVEQVGKNKCLHVYMDVCM